MRSIGREQDEKVHAMSGRAATPQVFVGFFGIDRSMRWTERSLRRNILDPLRAAGISPRVAAHFNTAATINKSHGGENNVKLGRPRLDRLPLELVWLEEQSIGRLPPELHRWTELAFDNDLERKRLDRVHLMYQLRSLRQLWTLAGLMGAQDCDLFIFIRPDLEYLDPIDVAGTLRQVLEEGVDLITPTWHQFEGLNDRFAFCSRRGAEVYVDRLSYVTAFSEERGYLSGEGLVAFAAEKNQLKLGFTGVRAMRVRATGATWREEFKLTPWQLGRSIARKRLARIGL